jgi:hypothetical protein
MILLIAALASFMTWLSLSLSDVVGLPMAVACAGVFLAVGGTLLHYVLSCMRRHCREWGHKHTRAQPLT